MRQFRLILAVLVIAALATSAFAQGTQQKMRHQRQGYSHGQKGMPSKMQHGLTSRQRQQIMVIRSDAKRQTARINANTTLSPSQKQRRIERVWSNARMKVKNVLTPSQRQQFRAWWQGRGEITDQQMRMGNMPVGRGPSMGTGTEPGMSGINLTSAQKAKIAMIRKESQSEIKMIQENKSLTAQQKNERIMAVRKKAGEQMRNVLTEEQKKMLREKAKSRSK